MKELNGKVKLVYYWTEIRYKGFTIKRYRRTDLNGNITRNFNYEIWANNVSMIALCKTFEEAKELISSCWVFDKNE